MTTNGSEARPLPDGWTWTIASEVGDIVTGTTPRKADPDNYGDFIPFVKPGDLDSNEPIHDAVEYLSEKGAQKARILPSGSVMVTCIGATIGKTGISNATVATNQQINSIVVQKPTQSKYVYFYCLSNAAQDWIKTTASSTTLPILNKSKFSSLPLPLAPLPEQERIVSEIEKQFTRLDQAVASLRRLQSNLARYKASVLKAACDGRLVPQDANDEPAPTLLSRILAERRAQWQDANPGKKYKEPQRVETAELPDLPEGWVWTNLTELKTFSLYGPRFSSNDYAENGRLVLRTSDINESGKVDYTKAPRLPLNDSDFAKYRCNIGDLLVTRTGSLGTLAVFNDSVDAIPGAYLIQYRLAAPLITSWYIYYFLKSPVGQKNLVGGGAGVGRPNLNAPTIESIPIPLPPLAEQERIVAEVERRLSVVTATEQAITANLARAERLRQAILHRAFTGQLVPQGEVAG